MFYEPYTLPIPRYLPLPSFPSSVVEYFQGHLGVPPHGFPEPLRTAVLRGKLPIASGHGGFLGRPGAELAPVDFGAQKRSLEEHWGSVREVDVMSHIM